MTETSGPVNSRWVEVSEPYIIKQLSWLNLNTWQVLPFETWPIMRYYLISAEGYAYPYSLPKDMVERLASALNEKWVNMEWHKRLTQRAIDYYEANGEAENQAHEYWEKHGRPIGLPEPKISPPERAPKPGTLYVAILGLYFLTPELVPEIPPGGLHHLYIEFIDTDGKRIYTNARPHYVRELRYHWVGMHDYQKPDATVRIDKGLNEPGGNIDIYKEQVLSGFFINSLESDKFEGVHTWYPQNLYHQKYYIVLQLRPWGETKPEPPKPEPPKPDPPKPPIPTPGKVVGQIVFTVPKDVYENTPADEAGNRTFTVTFQGEAGE